MKDTHIKKGCAEMRGPKVTSLWRSLGAPQLTTHSAFSASRSLSLSLFLFLSLSLSLLPLPVAAASSPTTTSATPIP